MSPFMPRVMPAAAAALLSLAASTPAASASAGGDRDGGGTHLILVTQSVNDSSQAHFASLSCDPPGGTHPRAEAACGGLGAVDGGFGDLRSVRRMCTMQYAPVTLHAYGHWRGQPVHYSSETYANRCVAIQESGGIVFDY